MALRMVKLSRDPKTGSWKTRKVIPQDVRAAYGKANETPTWDASLTGPQVKAAYAAWLAEVEAKIERLRRIATATPIGLTNRELHALAAKWYRDLVRTYEDDPGDANGWEAAFDQIEAEDEDEAYAAHLRGEHYDGPMKRIPWVEDQMEALLEREGLVLDARTREALSEQLHSSYVRLCNLMIRRAAGDYGPDDYASSLPDWDGVAIAKPAAPTAVGLTDLFEKYVAERKPAASTIKAWRRQVAHLKDHLGHDDAARVTPADIVAWKDALLTPNAEGVQRAARTVRDTYLAVAKTVFGYGVENKLLSANPAAGVTVRGPKNVVLRDRGFTVDEARTILKGTLRSYPKYTPERALAVRWVPWLCAYSGARVNEFTQLRKEDVFQSDGVWVARITPEAGSTKTNMARIVPLHDHLIEQGFVAAVQAAEQGPLFYDPKRHRGGSAGNPQSKKVGEALASWVRDLGVTDPEVQPNHAWRHRFKTEARRANLDIEARYLLTGHKLKTDGAEYGGWTADALKREIDKLPRIDVSAATGSE